MAAVLWRRRLISAQFWYFVRDTGKVDDFLVCTCVNTYTHLNTHTRAHENARIHTRAHACTHTHSLTHKLIYIVCLYCVLTNGDTLISALERKKKKHVRNLRGTISVNDKRDGDRGVERSN